MSEAVLTCRRGREEYVFCYESDQEKREILSNLARPVIIVAGSAVIQYFDVCDYRFVS